MSGMAHPQWIEAISARLDGETGADESAAVDAHLAGCAGCREFAERAGTLTGIALMQRPVPVGDLVGAVLAAHAADTGARAACGCATTCRCGCQQGGRCRCSATAA